MIYANLLGMFYCYIVIVLPVKNRILVSINTDITMTVILFIIVSNFMIVDVVTFAFIVNDVVVF